MTVNRRNVARIVGRFVDRKPRRARSLKLKRDGDGRAASSENAASTSRDFRRLADMFFFFSAICASESEVDASRK